MNGCSTRESLARGTDNVVERELSAKIRGNNRSKCTLGEGEGAGEAVGALSGF
jgi:hypothetical protein